MLPTLSILPPNLVECDILILVFKDVHFFLLHPSLLSIPLLSFSLLSYSSSHSLSSSLLLSPSDPSSLPILSGMFFWPSLADVNTRARRLVSAWVKNQKREEQKQLHLMKVKVPFIPIHVQVYINQTYTMYVALGVFNSMSAENRWYIFWDLR